MLNMAVGRKGSLMAVVLASFLVFAGAMFIATGSEASGDATGSGDGSTPFDDLVSELGGSVPGDVIVLDEDATMTKSVEIPEGVTLVIQEGVTLVMGDGDRNVVLTVAGHLDVKQGGGIVRPVQSPDTAPVISVEGVVSMVDEGSVADDMMTDHVSFCMDSDGVQIHVHSNLEYASENASHGEVLIHGDIVGQDVVFSGESDSDLLVIIVDKHNSLTVSSIVLRNAELDVRSKIVSGGEDGTTIEQGLFTGTVVAESMGGDARIQADKASSFIIESSSIMDYGIDVAVMFVTGSPEGDFVVSSGVVRVDGYFGLNHFETGIGYSNASIAEDAEIVVPAGAWFFASGEEDALADIDGEVTIHAGSTVDISYASVTGCISISDGADFSIGYEAVVTGTVEVIDEDDTDKVSTYISGILHLGDPTDPAKVGTIEGQFDTHHRYSDDGFLVVYPGSDVSGALLDIDSSTGQSMAASTEFYINGGLYMTVYTSSEMNVDLFIENMDITVPGLETPRNINWYSDEAMDKIFADNIGDVERLYTSFDTDDSDVNRAIAAVMVVLSVVVVLIAMLRIGRP